MMTSFQRLFLIISLAAAVAAVPMLASARAATVDEVNQSAGRALQTLYSANPAAENLGRTAKAVLIFPSIFKIGFVYGDSDGSFDGAYGEGVLASGARVEGYYSAFASSWGMPAGARSYGYVVFLMSDDAVSRVHRSYRRAIGGVPGLVIVDERVPRDSRTPMPPSDSYAFIFDPQGVAVSASVADAKISRMELPAIDDATLQSIEFPRAPTEKAIADARLSQ